MAKGKPTWRVKLDHALSRNPFAPERFDKNRVLDLEEVTDKEFAKFVEDYGVLDLSKKFDPPMFVVRCSEMASAVLKDIPFARYSTVHHGWVIPPMWILFQVIGEHFPKIRITAEAAPEVAKAWAQGRREVALLRYLQRLKNDEESYSDVTGYRELQPRNYQKQAIKFTEAAWSLDYGVGIFDEQGLGKTCEVLVALDRYFEKRPEARVIIWAPKSALRSVWVREIVKFSKFLRPLVLDQSSVKQKAALYNRAGYYDYCRMGEDGVTEYVHVEGRPNCFLVNHESAVEKKRLRDECEFNPLIDAMMANPATFCIVDELHRLQSKSASRTKGITMVSRACRYRLGMTGTPGLPEHLWSQFHFLDPRIYPVNITEFTKRYIWELRVGAAVYNRKYKKIPELRRRMANYTLRRVQAQVLPELPAAQHDVEVVEMYPEQRRIYDELVAESVAHFETHEITKSAIAAKIHALRNVSGGHLKEDLGYEGKKRLYKKHRLGENAKLDRLLERIDQETAVADIQEMDLSRKIIVGCYYREDVAIIADALRSRSIKHVVITGDVEDTSKDKARSRVVDEFVDDPKTKVLVGITSTFGISLNLVPRLPGICTDMFFFSTSSDPRARDQAEKRILRSADTWKQLKEEGRAIRAVRFTDFVCENTYDETIIAGLRQKIDVSQQINGDCFREMAMGHLPKPKKGSSK